MPADVEPRDALAALRALRSEKEAPPGAMHRVTDRLSATLGITSSILDTGAAPPPAASAGPVTVLTRPWLAKAAWLLSGAAIGLGVHRGLDRAHVEPPVSPPAPMLSTAPSATPLPEADDSIEASTAPPAPAPRSTAQRRGPRTTDLAQERVLLDAARRSWTEGDATGCLTKLDDHARTFARGQLVEEREALRINALVATGQYDTAREEAAAFSRNHPKSFLAPSVAAALEAIP
jgi:hypothetical protein